MRVLEMDLLAPKLKKGKLLPCGILAELLENGSIPPRLYRSHYRALVLGATLCEFANTVGLGDFENGRIIKTRIPVTEERSIVSNLSVIPLLGPKATNLEPLTSMSLLSSQYRGLVRRVTEWAPPVLAPGTKTKPPLVVGNQIPFVLHRFHFPGVRIECFWLEKRSNIKASLEDLIFEIQTCLVPTVSGNRDVIIRASDSLEEAMLLTGLGRSRVAKIRSEQGVISL